MCKKIFIICLLLILVSGLSGLTDAQEIKRGFPPGHPEYLRNSEFRKKPGLQGAAKKSAVDYGTQITSTGSWKSYIDWSPDGKWIAFDQDIDIFIIPAEGGEPINLTEQIEGGIWYPAFTYDSGGVTFNNYNDIIDVISIDYIGIDGTNHQVLIIDAMKGVWSHNGRYFVFGVPSTDDLALYDSVTGSIAILAAGQFQYSPSCFSPDDEYVVTSMVSYDGSMKLFRIPVGGGEPEQLTFSEGDHGDPDYSPDGKWIIYTDWSAWSLYALNTETGESQPLFPEESMGNINGHFSPDGTMFAYLLDDGITTEVYIVDFPFFEPVPISLILTSPNGGEQLPAGQYYDITWTSSGIENVSLLWRRDDTLRWVIIANDVPADQDSFQWTVPDIESDQCRVRIAGLADGNVVADVSDSVFTISPVPTLRLIAPNGGENWEAGSQQVIRWESKYVDKINIHCTYDGGTTYPWVAESVDASTGSYTWTVPGPAENCKVWIYDISNSEIYSISWAFFTISEPVVEKRLRIIVPNYSVDWEVGTTQKIEWESSNIEYVDILYCTTIAENYTLIASKVDATQQSYLWTIPDTPSTDCRVRIVENIDGNWGMSTKSYAKFTISEPAAEEPYLRISAPNGGEEWEVESTQYITWDSKIVSNIKIEYSRDEGQNWNLVASGVVASDKSYKWLIPKPVSGKCRVRITDESNPQVVSESYANFTITPRPFIRVTSPDGGEEWAAGSTQTITWDFYDIDKFTIVYSARANETAKNWQVIADNVDITVGATSGSYTWVVPEEPSAYCIVRVTDAAGTGIQDVSDGAFTILPAPYITLIKPNGGEQWEVGSTHIITWTAMGVKTFTLEYSTAGGKTRTEIASNLVVRVLLGGDQPYRQYAWEIPDTPSSTCLVKVSDAENPDVSDESDEPFTISPSTVTFPDPNLDAVIRSNLGKHEGPLTGEDLAGLTDLDASERDISDLTGIEHCVNLQWLNLGNNQISDISPLSSLTNLTDLNIGGNQISDLSPLSSLTNMTGLLINGNQISDISPLSNLTNLQMLNLDGNQTNDISPLSGLTNLKNLILNGNQISELSPLSDLTGINILELQRNQISDLSQLSVLTNLENLVLNDNQISDISPLINLINLRGLLLNSNQISDINPLVNLTNLRVLYLDGNRIQDISPLAGLTKIGEEGEGWEYYVVEERDGVRIHLGLSGNRISDVNPLVSNTGIGEGDGIDLRGNPLNNEAHETQIPALQSRGANVLFDSPGAVTISVSYPNGGEEWYAGETYDIMWQSTGLANVKIWYTPDSGIHFIDIIQSAPASAGYYAWTIPGDLEVPTCYIYVGDPDDNSFYDVSDDKFSILKSEEEAYLELTYPVGGETIQAGLILGISWDSGGVNKVHIEYSTDNGINWGNIVYDFTASDGYYEWEVPDDIESTQCKIWIGDADNEDIEDENAGVFTIEPAGEEVYIDVLYPDGGEMLVAGEENIISWESVGVSYVDIYFTIDGGDQHFEMIAENVVASSESYPWTIATDADIESSDCYVILIDSGDDTIEDWSDNAFTITQASLEPYIAVTSPGDGQEWEEATEQDIIWQSRMVSQVRIEYSTDGGQSWNSVVNQTDAASGVYRWVIPNEVSQNCKVRITDVNNSAITAENMGFFAITQAPFLMLTSPNGGEEWKIGEEHDITWEYYGVNDLRIEFTSDDGASWTTEVEHSDITQGKFIWTIPDIESSLCRIRITATDNEAIDGTSKDTFTIAREPFIQVTAPVEGDQWEEESAQTIEWTSSSVSRINIEYSIDDGGFWDSIISNVDASAGSYGWTVPEGEYEQCFIRVSNAEDSSVNGVSGSFRIITSDFIRITAPAAGDKWTVNTDKEIRWQVSGVANVSIEVSYDDGNTWADILTASIDAYSGAFSWMVPDTPVGQCRIRIADTTRPENIFVISDSFELIRPELTIAHTPQTEAHENVEITFTATVTASAEIKSVILSYNRMGDSESKVTYPMEETGENTYSYSYTLPAGVFIAPGIEYRIVATDVNDVVGSSPVDVGLHSINAIVSEVNSTNEVKGGSEQTAYRMISIPLYLNATSIVEQIENSIPLGDTGTHWRLFRFPPGSTNPSEYPDIEPFMPGRAFWLISVNNFVLRTPEGKTVPTDEPFQIELKSGWNDIANPWMFNITWADIENPGNANLSALYTYEGQWSDPTNAPDTLEPWKGYAVRNLESGNRIIRLRTKSMTEKPAVPTDTEIWKLTIKASAGKALDTANHLGVRHDASMEWDKYDHVEPPPVGKYVSVSFPHFDWSEYPYNYTVDYRPPGNTISWDFNVKTNISRENVNIELAGIDNLPDGLNLVLIDRDIDERIDISGDSFSFISANDITERYFTLLVTDSTEPEPEQADIKPGEFVTTNCFPNPFNPQTTLRYELSKAGRVKISVFNSLGQMVRTYEPGYMAQGIHELVFDAVELTSGLYIYRIDAGYSSVTGKMLYMK